MVLEDRKIRVNLSLIGLQFLVSLTKNNLYTGSPESCDSGTILHIFQSGPVQVNCVQVYSMLLIRGGWHRAVPLALAAVTKY